MSKFKVFGSIFFFEIFVCILFICILFSSGFDTIASFRDNIRTYKIMRQADAIDRGLNLYSEHHSVLDVSSVSFGSDGVASYSLQPSFPESLDKLRDAQKMGYIASNIDFDSDFELFTYQVSSDKLHYKLSITLPNGDVYVSPLSNL